MIIQIYNYNYATFQQQVVAVIRNTPNICYLLLYLFITYLLFTVSFLQLLRLLYVHHIHIDFIVSISITIIKHQNVFYQLTNLFVHYRICLHFMSRAIETHHYSLNDILNYFCLPLLTRNSSLFSDITVLWN